MTLSRRKFLQSAIGGAAGAAVLGTPAARAANDYVNLTRPSSLLLGGPAPKFPNIQHVVVVMMENRSTDHFLGWWGETEGVRFDGRTSLGPNGTTSGGLRTANWGATGDPTFAQHQNFTGHGFKDPNHGHDGGRFQVLDRDGDGIPDGWTTEGSRTDDYSLSYYTGADLPVISRILQDFTSFDRYFCSWMGSTYPNRYYMHSAQCGGIRNNDFPQQKASENPQLALGWDWPTLWDFLTVRGVTWKYYYSNLPAIGLFGPQNMPNAHLITEYYADCAAGTLPQVAFVDPFFTAPEGLANDDHPHADIRLGQEFYSDVVTSFLQSSAWAKGAMFINYDEWGGFWDHVTPPAVGTDVDPRAAYGPGRSPDYRQAGPHTEGPDDFGLYGFRTPAFLLSPYARNTGTNLHVDAAGRRTHSIDRTVSTRQDHTTILAFIAENWGLPNPGEWHPGARTPQQTMRNAFRPSIMDPDDPGDPEVDVAAYAYEAPTEARDVSQNRPPTSVSELWRAADWLEDLGYRVNTRFEDSLPVTRR